MHVAKYAPLAALAIFGLMPLAASAQASPIDAPTQTALTALRTSAATAVAKLSNRKGVTGDQVTASYSDQLRDVSAQQMNTVMIVKGRAEASAWTQLDPTSRALIKNYFASSH